MKMNTWMLDTITLSILSTTNANGQIINKILSQKSNGILVTDDISIWATLTRLEEANFVEGKPYGNAASAKDYTITSRGREELAYYGEWWKQSGWEPRMRPSLSVVRG